MLAACAPKDEPSTLPSLDDWRLGAFEMTLNGEPLDGTLTSVSRVVAERNNPEADAYFSFTEHTDDLYELRQVRFTIKCKVGHYPIDTIRSDGRHPDEWPYDEVRFYHKIEYGHVSGVEYLPILHDTIADFIAVDSIVGETYYGRFQVSLVSIPERRREVPHAPDTVIIRDGRVAIREYISR